MNFFPISVLIFSFSVFTWGTFLINIKTWFYLKDFKHIIRGSVDNIVIENNKLYFIIKWMVPEKIKEDNPGKNNDVNEQYYHFFVKKVKTMSEEKKALFINEYINKHAGRLFILKAKVDDGTVREVTSFEEAGLYSIVSLILALISTYFFITI